MVTTSGGTQLGEGTASNHVIVIICQLSNHIFLQTAKRNIVNTKIEAKVDICTGEVSINQFTLFSVHCPLRLDWYPFDTQVVKNK